VGVGGIGVLDMDQIMSHPDVDVVALCDVDSTFLSAAAAKAPQARQFRDWRVLLEQEELDSINVSTPDHMHAPITLAALERRLHVYCQKPLTRTVEEARAVAAAARRARVATQMGIQNHSASALLSAHALFQQDPIGAVHEAHVWTDRPAGWWPQGVERPEGEDPVPETLEWDLWLGVAPARPYKSGAYHPFAWRGWKDFGTGAQGDMACHLMDPVPWFLEVGAPLSVRSEGPSPPAESYPPWSTIRCEFARTPRTHRGPLVVVWHDGGRTVPKELCDDHGVLELPSNGCLFFGERGAMLASPYDVPRLHPAERFTGVAIPAIGDLNHWHEWVDACLGRGPTSAPFSYAALLTEIALLGNVALHFPHETLRFDGEELRFPKRKAADSYLRASYREGWEVAGLT
jgi:predicted dehydrogenase